MKKLITLLALCVLVSSCAASEKQVGSEAWYTKRLAEIEEAYKNKKIDDAEYLKLKNETDAVRVDYQQRRSNTQTHFGFGTGGGSVGVGVGF